MKKKPFINLSIRLRFIFMIMSELVCVSLISWLVMDVLHIGYIFFLSLEVFLQLLLLQFLRELS